MARKIRLGFVGANGRATWAPPSHFPARLASPDVELTAVCTAVDLHRFLDTIRQASETGRALPVA
jgi:predicted dehydrogenase